VGEGQAEGEEEERVLGREVRKETGKEGGGR